MARSFERGRSILDGSHGGQPDTVAHRANHRANPATPRHVVALPDLVRMLPGWSTDPGSLYRNLADRLGELIMEGTLPAGALLPSERALAGALSLSRRTVEAANDLLWERGLVRRRTGVGTWCTPPEAPSPVELASVASEDFIEHLLRGYGSLDLTIAGLPAHPLVAEAGLATAAAGQLDYHSHGYVANGLPALLHRVCDWFDDHGVPTRPEQIVVTTGAAQALWLAAALLPARSEVRVENPTSPTILTALRAHHLRLRSVPVDEDGIIPPTSKEHPAALFLSPCYLNPSGAHLAPDRCRAVADLARRGTLVVEDLALSDIRLNGPKARTIAALAPDAQVLSIGSMSKMFWGGLRVGWIRGPAPLIRRISRMKAALDIGTGVDGQAQAAWLLERRAQVRADRLPQVRRQRDALIQALRLELPDWECAVPQGGLSVWLRLPEANAQAVCQRALRHGIRLLPGHAFTVRRREEAQLRLPYVHPAAAQGEIVRGLAAAVRACRDQTPE